MNKRLTNSQKVKLHEFWVEGKGNYNKKNIIGFIDKKIKNCIVFKDRKVDYKTIKRWTNRWKKQGFTIKEDRDYIKKPK